MLTIIPCVYVTGEAREDAQNFTADSHSENSGRKTPRRNPCPASASVWRAMAGDSNSGCRGRPPGAGSCRRLAMQTLPSRVRPRRSSVSQVSLTGSWGIQVSHCDSPATRTDCHSLHKRIQKAAFLYPVVPDPRHGVLVPCFVETPDSIQASAGHCIGSLANRDFECSPDALICTNRRCATTESGDSVKIRFTAKWRTVIF